MGGLNDIDDFGDFGSKIEDETTYPLNASENGLERDIGSGSFATDGRGELAEDHVMMNGESAMGGPAATDGQSEIGTHYPTEGGSEIGHDPLASQADVMRPFESFMLDEVRIGQAAVDGASEIGQAARDGQTEIGGLYPTDGASEIGEAADVLQGPAAVLGGQYATEGGSEIGTHYPTEGGSEIGQAARDGQTEIGAALLKVVEKARDNRQPPPPLKVVDADAPPADDSGDFGADVVMGAAAAVGANAFPLFSEYLVRAGSGMPPRYVRVDTEESYKGFRTAHSPEMSDLAARVAELEDNLRAHVSDPDAHSALAEDVEELTVFGAEVDAAEKDKRIELWMPRRFEGNVEAWREGDMVCASLKMPGRDGEVRICTSMEPIQRCVDEMARHAAESGASPSSVVGVLPAMGCVLGAGTVLKEMAAAAPAIAERPEMASPRPFVVRVEPKTNPTLCALAMLAMACNTGNQQACQEWSALATKSPPQVRQAMLEAAALAKAAGGEG